MGIEHGFSLRDGGCYLISQPGLSGDLVDGDAPLDERSSIPVIFEYPLSKPVEFALSANWPFTARTFAEAVSGKYAEICAEEEATSETEAGPVPGMLNRNRTSGKHGIWGHGIDDLVLEFAIRQPDGRWRLFVGS